MELNEYITMQLDGAKRMMNRVLDTLQPAELAWRPACGCNSIGLILFHVIRSEDSLSRPGFREKLKSGSLVSGMRK